jgi:predicted Zn-dependent peptidase
VEALGGNVQTLAERDYCCYAARCPGADVEKALDLLTELSLYPQITKTGFAAETKKALEDLREDEDAPDFMLDRMFFRSFWKGHGLCRPPKGRLLHSKGQTKLENFKPKTIERYHTRSHHPKGLTVIAAGAIDHEKLVKMIDKRFGGLEEPKKKVSSPSPTAFRFLALRNRPQFEDIRFRLGVPACNASEPDRHPARLLNAILGGGPGSRLARKVAEGVLPAIEAFSELDMFADAGCLSVRARTERESAVQSLEIIVAEMRKLAFGEIGEAELDWAKAYCRTQLLEGVGSLETRVDDLARQERYFHHPGSLEEEIGLLENVKAERVRMLSAAWIAPHHLSLAVLGNLKGVNVRPSLLSW